MPVQRPHVFRYIKGALFFIILGAGVSAYWTGVFPSEKIISVQIKFINIPDHLVIVGHPENTIDVRICGPGAALRKLSEAELFYTADLSGFHEGKNAVAIAAEKIPVPGPIRIKEITPPYLTVALEKEIIKKLPVTPRCVGNPKFGWHVAEQKIEPASVLLKGPESILATMKDISTQPIDLTNHSGIFATDVPLKLPGDRPVYSTPDTVNIEIIITEKIITKTFKKLPVYKKNTSYQVVIQPDGIDITVQGPLLKVSGSFSKDDIDAYVDLDQLQPGIHVKPATISLPVGISLVKADPEIFTVQITQPSTPGD